MKQDVSSPIADTLNRKTFRFRKLGKRSFYLWIAYQTIKGTLTTLFIWVPLIYWHFIR